MRNLRVDSLTAIYFSPTGTTKKLVQALCKGFEGAVVGEWDLTRPASRDLLSGRKVSDDLLVIGLPVYEERIPKIILPFLNNLEGHGQPVVMVAVYGNVSPGMLLPDLAKLLKKKRFFIAAGVEVVAEHSFSSDALPIAKGRPDEIDLQYATDCGKKIRNYLESHDNLREPLIRGELLLMAKVLPDDAARVFTSKPDVDLNKCIRCGICAEWCPGGAIDRLSLKIEDNLCIRCFSCVKRCPAAAREIRFKPHLGWLAKPVFRRKGRKRREAVLHLSEE